MKNKIVICVIISFAFIVPGWGQTDNQVKSFNLQQCIEYGLMNSDSIKNSYIDEQIAKARVKEITGIGLPQINGSVALLHNIELPRFFSALNPKSPLLPPEAIPVATAYSGQVVAQPNFFQLKSSGDANITASQIIFSGSYLVGLQAARAYKDLTLKTTENRKIQLIEKISKAFFLTLINKERLELFNQNINRIDSTLKNTKALLDAGFVEKLDVDRLQVSLNNLLIERDKFSNLQELNILLLKFQMNYPLSESLQLTGDIKGMMVDKSFFEVDTAKVIVENRPEYKLIQAGKKLQSLDVKNNYAGLLPTISAFGTYGYSTQSPNIAGLFKTQTAKDVEEYGINRDKWYDYSRIGLNVSIPIFSGMQKTYKIQQAKLNYNKIENNLVLFGKAVDLQVQSSKIILRNNLKALEAQNANLNLASEVARVTKVKYQEGVGSNIEVITAENELRTAQTNYYNALYDALVAKIDLQKALGTLSTQQ